MKPTNNGGHKQRLPRFQCLANEANDDGYATVAAAGIIVAIVAVSLSLMGGSQPRGGAASRATRSRYGSGRWSRSLRSR